ncbi:MAG: hypothetical protein LBB80_10300 [Treponema sp.]|jgi:hypothetical protein|nr:hypothetical protein [Treponema sp.]
MKRLKTHILSRFCWIKHRYFIRFRGSTVVAYIKNSYTATLERAVRMAAKRLLILSNVPLLIEEGSAQSSVSKEVLVALR